MADIFVLAFPKHASFKGLPKEKRDLPGLAADNYMDVQRWTWSLGHGADESGDSRTGQKAGGQANVALFEFTRYVDMASPKLIEGCFNGVVFPEAEFHCYRMIGGNKPYFSIWMGNGVVAEVSTGELNEDNMMLETVKLSMTKFKTKFTPYDKDGKPGTPVEKAFDIKNHTKTY